MLGIIYVCESDSQRLLLVLKGPQQTVQAWGPGPGSDPGPAATSAAATGHGDGSRIWVPAAHTGDPRLSLAHPGYCRHPGSTPTEQGSPLSLGEREPQRPPLTSGFGWRFTFWHLYRTATSRKSANSKHTAFDAQGILQACRGKNIRGFVDVAKGHGACAGCPARLRREGRPGLVAKGHGTGAWNSNWQDKELSLFPTPGTTGATGVLKRYQLNQCELAACCPRHRSHPLP